MRFIVAANRYQAGTTAEIDKDWRRSGQDTWIDDDGETVRYAPDSDYLRGRGSCVIYLGYGWEDNPQLRGLFELAGAMNHDFRMIDFVPAKVTA